ncbi:MAG: NAD(P)-dependent oxidoreductase [Actinomycetota bacterium]|nr:NAD(P)-dependent oxidoreductase [Actinomycetota bacterium]
MTSVGVVGLGAMGSRIARRFLDAGHEVVVWNRSPEKAEPLVALGALTAVSPAEVAERSDVVITMLADGSALQGVTETPSGIASVVGPSTTVIEMSTVGPAAIARLVSALPVGTPVLDAPVLGSISEAETGALKIFVGGPAALFERCAPLLSVLGSPLHFGPLGFGAAAKLVANSTLFGALGLVGEAVALADALGLSREVTFEVLAGTPMGAQAERRREAIETGAFPPRFSLALAVKDVNLIVDAAAAAGVDLRLSAAARQWLVDAAEAGLGDEDYSAVLAYILGRR